MRHLLAVLFLSCLTFAQSHSQAHEPTETRVKLWGAVVNESEGDALVTVLQQRLRLTDSQKEEVVRLIKEGRIKSRPYVIAFSAEIKALTHAKQAYRAEEAGVLKKKAVRSLNEIKKAVRETAKNIEGILREDQRRHFERVISI